MELQDYATALRRHWVTWVGLTLVGGLVALAVLLFAPRSYEATAQVFVATTRGENGGWQFVSERVGSYPDIAESRTVLEPVIDQLDLDDEFADLRGQVSANNPPDTSQIDISVTHSDPERAADLANAVADRFQFVVEQLERPGDGVSPVDLTVTDPATASSTPVFPLPSLVLPLGVVVGLGLGLAAALARSQRDTRVHRPADVRSAWGTAGDRLAVLSSPVRRRRQGAATGPEVLLARRLEAMALDAPVQVVALTPGPGEAVARAFVTAVARELVRWGVPATVGSEPLPDDGSPPAQIHLTWADPVAPSRERRGVIRDREVVVVVESGRTEADDLREIRSVLDAARARVVAVALVTRRESRRLVEGGPDGMTSITDDPTRPVAARAPEQRRARASTRS